MSILWDFTALKKSFKISSQSDKSKRAEGERMLGAILEFLQKDVSKDLTQIALVTYSLAVLRLLDGDSHKVSYLMRGPDMTQFHISSMCRLQIGLLLSREVVNFKWGLDEAHATVATV